MEEYGFYEYKVEYWDEIQKKMTAACGVVCAKSFSEAMNNIEDYYDSIVNVNLFGLEPFSVYEFNDEQNNFRIKEECING